ncbi:MAG: hypothetical protein QOJ73_563 [Streptosporangiaceae bacterium]|jgi:hypothetical protein|nr:hypothetical protein [Streptosporangiaceae bacterium]
MDAQTIIGLLTPLIGKSGRLLILRRGSSALQSLTTDKLALTRVELRPDGLIQTWHDRGWDVFDPADVVAVEWMGDQGTGGGQYL